MACLTGDGVCCAEGPHVSSRDQFDSKILNDDRSHRTQSEQFVIKEKFVATLDYLGAASLWVSITKARDQELYYLHSVNYYKHHNGKEGGAKLEGQLV